MEMECNGIGEVLLECRDARGFSSSVSSAAFFSVAHCCFSCHLFCLLFFGLAFDGLLVCLCIFYRLGNAFPVCPSHSGLVVHAAVSIHFNKVAWI